MGTPKVALRVRPHLRPRHELVADLKLGVSRKPPLDVSRKPPKGIPQGTPISATLANLYMLAVDSDLAQFAEQAGGLYRRYSDDLLFVIESGRGPDIEDLVTDALRRIGLELAEDKTFRARCTYSGGTQQIRKLSASYEDVGRGTIDYLGLSYDGENIRIRPSTISRFHMRMSRGVRQAEYVAKESNAAKLRRRKLLARFSSYGPGRAYEDLKQAPGGLSGYVRKVAEVTGSAAASKQSKQLDQALFQRMAAADRRLIRRHRARSDSRESTSDS